MLRLRRCCSRGRQVARGMTRFNTVGGVWGEGSSRIDDAIASGTEAERWKVAEEIHPEHDRGGATHVPLSDHLLIELRRKAARPRPELEQRPVAVRLDSSADGRATAAAYAARATGSEFAQQLRSDAARAQRGGKAAASLL